ncbi:hypothetical protein L0P54_00475 [Anaerosalibacter bizertensis]|uniref:Uncharacterized protein n=1 Tax=Anaerosalibacter bizertensis TaxID=932217 RepID=A0A9Q4FJT8_9FIRM|nr:hypothetical protein [Anaerosalibacter bizertensis]MBV1816467.1 hypothetical protein [Bacteroidales bacterium MSK.15.36]MBU5292509.1 hypothetical protein [Anaerosalibacter bizertensis]MCB5558526.1 hypothetical protein [Anaerosalibacter bizertensis]MCG4563856.1 hypothetical protein [Anaerosalibacter bizertensis]MCG4581444.1 hypothetical protein [Anaerosalibacter bizertensis]
MVKAKSKVKKVKNIRRNNKNTCPECGSMMAPSGGCFVCPACGYSPCSI